MTVFKNTLSPHAVLPLQNGSEHITLDTDACAIRERCALLQHQKRRLPYRCEIREDLRLWLEKISYSTASISCNRMIRSPSTVPHKGIQVTFRTRNGFLKLHLILTEITARLACCCLRLFKYELNIFHRAKIERQAVNALFGSANNRRELDFTRQHHSIAANRYKQRPIHMYGASNGKAHPGRNYSCHSRDDHTRDWK